MKLLRRQEVVLSFTKKATRKENPRQLVSKTFRWNELLSNLVYANGGLMRRHWGTSKSQRDSYSIAQFPIPGIAIDWFSDLESSRP